MSKRGMTKPKRCGDCVVEQWVRRRTVLPIRFGEVLGQRPTWVAVVHPRFVVFRLIRPYETTTKRRVVVVNPTTLALALCFPPTLYHERHESFLKSLVYRRELFRRPRRRHFCTGCCNCHYHYHHHPCRWDAYPPYLPTTN